MTDPAPDPRDASPDTGKVRRVPPLVWVILGLLVLMIAIGVSQYGGKHVTPSGGVALQDQATASDAVMPAPEAAEASSAAAPSMTAPGDPTAETAPPAAPPPVQTPAP